MHLVCDFNLWLEKDRDFVRDGTDYFFFEKSAWSTLASVIETNGTPVLQAAPLQWFRHLEAPVEPITGAKDLSVIRKPTSRWKTQFPNGNTVWEPINFRWGSLWNDETVVVPVSSNSLLWVFFILSSLSPSFAIADSSILFYLFCRRVRPHQPSAKKRAYSRNGGRRYQLARSSLAWFFRAGRV